jgi:hypothetical protein
MNLIPHITYSHTFFNYIPRNSQSWLKKWKKGSSLLILWFIFSYVRLWECIVTLCPTSMEKQLFWEQNHKINLNRRPASEVSIADLYPTGQVVHYPLSAGIMTEVYYAFPHCLHTNSDFSSKKAAHFTAPPPEFCNNNQPTKWRFTT